MHPIKMLPADIVDSLSKADLTDLKKFTKGKLPYWFASGTDNRGIWFSALNDDVKYTLVDNPYITGNYLHRLWKFDSQHIDNQHRFMLGEKHNADYLLWDQSFALMSSFLRSSIILPHTVHMMVHGYLYNSSIDEAVNEKLRILYYHLIRKGQIQEFALSTIVVLVDLFIELGESYMGNALQAIWRRKTAQVG